MMSYPTESQKGRFIAIFWAIFNLGAVVGAVIPVAQNWSSDKSNANDGTYIAFLVLMFSGAVLACCMAPSHKIVRKDGTKVRPPVHPSIWSEFKGLFITLKEEPMILFLFPMFFATNWFYEYQFNNFNASYFNLRTRSFNSLFYWLGQIVGSGCFGIMLDWSTISRRARALLGWVSLFILVNVIWGGAYAHVRHTCRTCDVPNENLGSNKGMDIFDKGYAGLLILYILFGVLDAMYQTFAYWTMSSMSIQPRRLAYFAGYYKGIQSAASAITWSLDNHLVSYIALFGSSWGLSAGGLLIGLPVYLYRIQETEVSLEDYLTKKEVLESTGLGIMQSSFAEADIETGDNFLRQKSQEPDVTKQQ